MLFHCLASPISLFNVCSCHQKNHRVLLADAMKALWNFRIGQLQYAAFIMVQRNARQLNVKHYPSQPKGWTLLCIWKCSIKVICLWLALLWQNIKSTVTFAIIFMVLLNECKLFSRDIMKGNKLQVMCW